MPNNMSFVDGEGLLPSNETFATTGLNGAGSSAFDVWNSETNLDLGCSQTVPCALVAVPVMGISCDPTAANMPPDDQPTPAEEPAAAATCEQTGYWPPGTFVNSGDRNYDQSVSGDLWWAASNWRNRFVVPLKFAPPQNICQIVSKSHLFLQIYGSELMDQAMLQWQPHFCLNRKLFNLAYVSFSEPPIAAQLAQGSIEAALLSQQPHGGTTRPLIHEPAGHHRRPGVPGTQPWHHEGRRRHGRGVRAACPIHEFGRDVGTDLLHQRRSRRPCVAERQAGPVGDAGQQEVQGHRDADVDLAAAQHL
jgi:hypothetical protein